MGAKSPCAARSARGAASRWNCPWIKSQNPSSNEQRKLIPKPQFPMPKQCPMTKLQPRRIRHVWLLTSGHKPLPRACPKSNDWGLFVAHFVETLCRKSPQTAVSDKVGDEVVTTMWIKTVALGQALARAMGKVWRRCPTCGFWRRPAARSARTTGRDARSTRRRGRLRYFVNRLGRDAATQELKIALASLAHFA